MKNQERKGSAITAIITALVLAIILAIFGRSVQGGAEKDYSLVITSTATVSEPQVVGSGFYHITILEEAKHHFIPKLHNMK